MSGLPKRRPIQEVREKYKELSGYKIEDLPKPEYTQGFIDALLWVMESEKDE